MKRHRDYSQGDRGEVLDVAVAAAMQGGDSEEKKRNRRAAAAEKEAEMVAMAAEENWVEEWAWWRWGDVDEQMSWGYMTLPKWGVEFMAEAYGELFSDVVWDFDIWNLKTIQEVPANP